MTQRDKRIQGSRVLVTGGAGFIGSHLCRTLDAQGNEVICLDDFSSGKRENLNGLLGKNSFRLVEASIENPSACAKAMKGVEYVFHHAAIVSVVKCQNDPKLTEKINREGLIHILEAAAAAKVKRVVYASSSAVYGNSGKMIQEETDELHPESAYGFSKMQNEQDAARLENKQESFGLRYFNVYGERQDPDGPYAAVVPKFIQVLFGKKSPTIFGNGLQTRDFVHVSDVVRANQYAALHTKNKARICNIATGKPTSINELLVTLRRLFAENFPELKMLPTVYENARSGEVFASNGSPVRARTFLSFEALTELEDGLRSLVRAQASAKLAQRKSS